MTSRYEWMSDAACAGRSDLFEEFDSWQDFLGRERSEVNEVRIEQAKAVCRTCPVIEDCRAYMDHFEGKAWAMNLSGMVAAAETTRERVLRRRQERRLAAWSA